MVTISVASADPAAGGLTAGRAIVLGALTVGTLDIVDAFVFFGLRGASPLRILQSIAAGLLGSASHSGGWPTAVLGGVLHFGIAMCIVLTYWMASQRWPSLVARPYVHGSIYGVAVYSLMNFVVIPLSAITPSVPSWPVLLNGVGIHIAGVGVPTALWCRAARQ